MKKKSKGLKSEKIIKLLNKHFNRNIQLGLLYTKFYTYIANNSVMTNLVEYVKDLANDKLGVHKDKIINYMMDIGESFEEWTELSVTADYDAVSEVVNTIAFNERDVMDEMDEIAETALNEKDFQTFEFIQWFIKDGLKDYNEIKYIADLFEATDDLVAIDNKIACLLKK